MNDIRLLLKAIHFAADKHRDQRRKGAEASPYINHPIEVAQLLADVAGVTDAATLSAAVLHDTIEDTCATEAELIAEFGEVIAGIVVEVTDDKSLPKQERKRLQVEHATHLSRPAKLVKLADKICNVTDMTERPPSGWSRERKLDYCRWASEVVEGLRGTDAALEARFDAAVARRSA